MFTIKFQKKKKCINFFIVKYINVITNSNPKLSYYWNNWPCCGFWSSYPSNTAAIMACFNQTAQDEEAFSKGREERVVTDDA